MPMLDKEAIRLEKNLKKVAKEYGEAFQKQVLNSGKYEQLLEEWIIGDQYKNILKVDFPKSKDGYSYPAFEIEFDYYLSLIHI